MDGAAASQNPQTGAKYPYRRILAKNPKPGRRQAISDLSTEAGEQVVVFILDQNLEEKLSSGKQ